MFITVNIINNTYNTDIWLPQYKKHKKPEFLALRLAVLLGSFKQPRMS